LSGLNLSNEKACRNHTGNWIDRGDPAMLGAGIALLLSDKLAPEQRRAIGWTLVAVGALTTFPLALEVFGDGEE